MKYIEAAIKCSSEFRAALLDINKLRDISVRDFMQIETYLQLAYESGYKHGAIKLHGEI